MIVLYTARVKLEFGYDHGMWNIKHIIENRKLQAWQLSDKLHKRQIKYRSI